MQLTHTQGLIPTLLALVGDAILATRRCDVSCTAKISFGETLG
jgi:hypothetical protein